MPKKNKETKLDPSVIKSEFEKAKRYRDELCEEITTFRKNFELGVEHIREHNKTFLKMLDKMTLGDFKALHPHFIEKHGLEWKREGPESILGMRYKFVCKVNCGITDCFRTIDVMST